jgi:N-acetylglucosaminyldiphosphoundecaprenol N-acetyl-beta-D-mannosaminyltransferase
MDSISLFGQKFSSTNIDATVELFEKYIEKKTPHQVCICNVHTTMMAFQNKKTHSHIKSASILTMDGQPLVWLAKFLGAHNAERVAGPDLMEKACRISTQKGYRHFFYGGADGVPEKIKALFEAKHPGIQIVGAYSPPFRPLTGEEEESVVRLINDSKPDFLWVGLGAPKQEQWIADHINQINAPVQIGVGAAFDFFTGSVQRAPVWMQRVGLEWLFRLLKEPRRLWKRYFLYNTMFLIYLIPEILKHKFSSEYR